MKADKNNATPWPRTPTKFSIERFLLNRGWWLLAILAWAYLVGWSYRSYTSSITEHHYDIAKEGSRNLFRMIELTRLWNANHGGVYVPVTPQTQPNPYLDVPNRDIETKDNVRLTMINPAFMTRQIAELVSTKNNGSFHITSLKPIRPANRADRWETSALLQFEEGAKEIYGLVKSNNSDLFRYMAPLVTEKACLKCHEKQGYKEGDIRGGISVTLQASSFFGEDYSDNLRQVAIRHLVTFILVALLLLFFLERLRRQWNKLRDIEEHQQAIIAERTRELEHLATHDPLTKLYNRNAYEQRIEAEFSRTKRYGHNLSLLVLDIDHFKQVNDSHGHLAGDQVLASVSGRLQETIRQTDYAARFGGEEFVIILPETDSAEARELAERICKAIATHVISLCDGTTLNVTASIGIASYPDHAENQDELLELADKAMYIVKRKGRNGTHSASHLSQ